jgi:hypothetical protein
LFDHSDKGLLSEDVYGSTRGELQSVLLSVDRLSKKEIVERRSDFIALMKQAEDEQLDKDFFREGPVCDYYEKLISAIGRTHDPGEVIPGDGFITYSDEREYDYWCVFRKPMLSLKPNKHELRQLIDFSRRVKFAIRRIVSLKSSGGVDGYLRARARVRKLAREDPGKFTVTFD